jgi:hypothetical protein
MDKLVNLCPGCKYITKCRWIKNIQERFDDVVMDALDDHEINIEAVYIISECPRFMPSLEDLEEGDDYE